MTFIIDGSEAKTIKYSMSTLIGTKILQILEAFSTEKTL